MTAGKIRYCAFRLLRFAAAMLLFAALSVVMSSEISAMFRAVEIPIASAALLRVLQAVLSIVLHGLCFYSVLREFLLRDGALRERFRKQYVAFGTFQIALFRFPEVWVFLAGVALLAFRFPEVFGSAEWVTLLGAGFGWVGAILYLLEAGVIFALIARKWRSASPKSTLKKEILGLLCALAFLAFAYIAMSLMSVAILPMFCTVWKVLVLLFDGFWQILLPVAAVLLLAFLGLRYGRALVLRRRFLQRLKGEAAESGYRLSSIRRPYASVFSPAPEVSFTLSRGEELYSCRMLPFLKRSVRVIFSENGMGSMVKRIRFRRKIELATVETSFSYAFPGEGRKIIVLIPTPHTAFVSMGGARRPMDNGDRIGEYVFFTGSGLANAVRRDFLARY